MKEITRDTVLGIVFFGALAVLTYFTVYLTEFSFTAKPRFQVRFTEAAGLKAGDPVLVLGTRTGRVISVAFDDQTSDERRVIVTLQLDRPLTLKHGFAIKIEESSFLGGRVATIDPGPPTAPAVGAGTVLTGLIEEGPLAELGKVVEANKDDFNGIIAGVKKIVDRAEKGEGSLGKFLKDDALYNSFKDTFENAKEISQSIKEGKGTLGRLVKDETLADNVSTTVTRIGDIAKDLKEGKGTLGKLLTDDTLYNNANEVVAKIRDGKGTLGKLVNDEQTAQDVTTALKNFREISEKINTGEGTLAKLVNEKGPIEDLSAAAKDIREIVADVKEGKGTLGKLIRDDTLYADIQSTFKSLNRSIEDGREAAPIGTFSALLFSSF